MSNFENNSGWDKIQDTYLKGDRYLMADRPDAKGKCKDGYSIPITAQVFPTGTTENELNYWLGKYKNLRTRCLPDPGTKDLNAEWFAREDKRDLDFKLLAGEGDLDITKEYWAPQHCLGGWCPGDFLPNERAIGTGHMEGYLESYGDCTHQGGKWIDNKANNAHWKDGGVCIFMKGHVPKYVQAANYHTESTCTSAGFSWDNNWLNRISNWSTPCSYIPSASDDTTYNGDQSTRNTEELFDKMAGGINNIPDILGFWERVLKWLVEHPSLSVAIVVMLLLGPYIAPIIGLLTR